MKKGLFYRRLIRPILELLRQGVTPEKIALSIALGVALGVFPALGWTTALCALAAVLCGLNLPILQVVNYFMYPAQIALLIPFFRLGEKLFRAPHLPISAPQIFVLAKADLWSTIALLWSTTWHAIVAWGLIAPGVAGLVFVILSRLLRRLLERQSQPAAENL